MPAATSATFELQAVDTSTSGAADPGSQPEAQFKIEHDNKYYFRHDPMAVFLVEDRLFKIHRHHLSEGSEVFRNMFASPVEEGVNPDGTSDEQPISLPEVTKREFETLLDYFYLPSHKRSHLTGSNEQNLRVYLDLLAISHRFLFDDIFQFTLGKLQPMVGSLSIIQRLVLGEKYNLKEWLFSAYESLLDRTATLTLEEAEVLGFNKVVRYIQAREAMHQNYTQTKEAEHRRASMALGVPQGKKGLKSRFEPRPKSPIEEAYGCYGREQEAPVKLSSRTLVQQFFQ